MSAQPFIIERVVNAPVSKVWKAITDKDQMKKWYFEMDAFEAKPGFEFRFAGGDPGGQQYIHLCKVLESVTEKKLSHSWTYEGYEGYSVVTWELTDLGGKTKVKLTHEGIDSFPDLPAFKRENFEAGWNDIVGNLLPGFVEK